MGTQQTQLRFGALKNNKELHPLLTFPLTRKILGALLPGLLTDPGSYSGTLDAIHHYLFEQKNLKSPKLRKELPKDLYDTLCGLKMLLGKHSLNVVTLALEEHKRRFGIFIEEELLDPGAEEPTLPGERPPDVVYRSCSIEE